jgi:hypothetical protein
LVIHKSGFPFGSAGCKDEDGCWEASITETDDAYIGYPVQPDGSTLHEQITLPKSQWKQLLKSGDSIIRLHIPSGVQFDPASIEESLAQMCQYLEQYFPEITTRIFCCSSWMMDPQLVEMLGPDANISKFCRRFTPMAQKSKGNAVMNFIFFDPDRKIPLKDLPEDSRFQRALKQHYTEGKVIYEMFGYFLP